MILKKNSLRIKHTSVIFTICVLFIFIFIFLPSCSIITGRNKCGNLIEKEKMVNIITDFYIIESYINIASDDNPSIKDSVEYYYAGIFKKHDITKELFDEAFECYALDKDNLAYIKEEAMNNLSIMQSREEKKKEQTKSSSSN